MILTMMKCQKAMQHMTNDVYVKIKILRFDDFGESQREFHLSGLLQDSEDPWVEPLWWWEICTAAKSY